MTTRDEILAMAKDKRCRAEYERGGVDREWYEFTADELVEFFRLAQAAAYERAATAFEQAGAAMAWGVAKEIRDMKKPADTHAAPAASPD